MNQTKFSTLIDEKVLAQLKQYSEENGKNISWVVNEAVSEFLQRTRVRPVVRKAMDEVLKDHADLFRRLAK